MKKQPDPPPCKCQETQQQKVLKEFERIDQKLKEQGTPGRFPWSEERAHRPEFNW